MLKKPDLCCETSGHHPPGGNPKLRSVQERLHSERKMTNYVSFLLETDAAKRRLTQLFESETLRSADHRSIAIAPRDRSHATQISAEDNNNTFREYRCAQTHVRSRTRTAIPTIESGQTQRDLTVSSFMLALVLVGVVVAAHTDRPVFWLLVGPAPFAVLHTIRTLLRKRVTRREGLLTFCERDR
jgi:hypothetical protein